MEPQLSWQWPTTASCAGAIAVAMPHGGPAIDAVEIPANQEPHGVLAKAGAAAWGTGRLDLLITVPENRTTTVDVHFHKITKTTVQQYDWLLESGEGCGGPSHQEHLELDLDQRELTKVDANDEEEKTDSSREPGVRGYVVTADEPLHVLIDARACSALYQWSVSVDYTSGSLHRTQTIGPLYTGGAVAGVSRYRLSQTDEGQRKLTADGRSGATCPPR
ncbi:hypothetical protein [Kineosporia sp. NBRC 101731]|uniref:hypothetical protein n=1 Tax=Kineosporia sp. NBRC 101731 TaxID=3032199 RepID=UPI0025575959|nr:hypothetical protein [Kineosporia sp. NBRC 101731]